MLIRVAAFELHQQLRSHVFWIVFAISALMVLGALSIEELRVGLAEAGPANGRTAIVRTHLVWTLFYLFTAAAFVADAVLRDDLTGFAPIIRTAPISRLDYLLGRFAGAFAATALCFLTVPAALLVGPLLNQEQLGPTSMSALAFALFVLALPNLFVSSAIFFGLATATRSMMGTLLGAVALLTLYGIGVDTGRGSVAALIEPFGFSALAHVGSSDSLAGILIANRVLWMAIGCAVVAIACLSFHRAERAPPARPAAPAASEAAIPAFRPVPRPSFGRGTVLTQLAARTRLEMHQLVLTPAFVVLLLLGIAHAAATLWQAVGANPALPTSEVIRILIDTFRLVPTVVAIFFAGELIWNEREQRVHEIVGTAPVPDAAFLFPKLLALALVLASLALVTAATAMLIQAMQGSTAPDLSLYLGWYVVPKSFDWLLVGVLAIFLQALSPNKLAGWGLMVLYLIASLTLEQTGYTDPLYRYGSYPGAPLPQALSDASGAGLYRAYWASAAVLLTTLAYMLAGRGSVAPLPARLARLPGKLRGAGGAIAAAALLSFLILGVYLSRS